MTKAARLGSAALLALAGWAASFDTGQAQQSGAASPPAIPKTWDDAAMADLELPLAHAPASPRHVPSTYYYRIRVRPIYQSYPVYHPDKEPSGYLDELRQREPVILWDDQDKHPPLETETDWIAAGNLVFESPIGYGRIGAAPATELYLREARWHKEVGAPVTPDGIVPFYRYVILKKGRVDIGILSCAMCHTRVMPDGSVIKGAQGNLPFDRAFAFDLRDPGALLNASRRLERQLYSAPWIQPDLQAGLGEMSLEQLALPHAIIPPGVLARHRTSPSSPVQVPDLIGVKGRHYLDRTGLQRHRDIADLMRYAALNQGGDDLSSFGGFVPVSTAPGRMPGPADSPFGRYSDEQLYALALFVYSLQPPANSNLPKTSEQRAQVDRGRKLFLDSDNGCFKCHDPKQGYTNNKLVRAPGFEPPDHHPAKDDLMPQRVNTDATLTTATRRGTGLYKVPSLLGVWYRGPFEHNGSCATLEDWFDPARTNETYVPTGWKGPPGTKTRAVKGHEYGLELSVEDRKALIAFLKTL